MIKKLLKLKLQIINKNKKLLLSLLILSVISFILIENYKVESKYPPIIKERLNECKCDPGVELSIFQEKLRDLEKKVDKNTTDITNNTTEVTKINTMITTFKQELAKEMARGL